MQLIRVLAVVGLQTIALAWMIVDRQHMLESSRVVTLRIVPVDPQDLFRGDYVALSYDISRLDVKTLAGDDIFHGGEDAFVTLQKQADGIWKASSISHKPALQAADDVAIRANVQNADDPTAQGPTWVSLTYGVESYYVPQGTGHAIENEARHGELSADLAIDASGRAAIKALRRGGKVFYVEGIF